METEEMRLRQQQMTELLRSALILGFREFGESASRSGRTVVDYVTLDEVLSWGK
jgi:hypothetical protein